MQFDVEQKEARNDRNSAIQSEVFMYGNVTKMDNTFQLHFTLTWFRNVQCIENAKMSDGS